MVIRRDLIPAVVNLRCIMEYRCVYSFVGRRSTTAETTAAAAAYIGVTTHMFFLIVVPWSYPELFRGFCTTTSITMYLSQESWKKKKKNTEQDQPAVRFIFHLVVEQSIHAETERPRVKKKQTTVYLIKRKMKNKILVYVPVAYMADTKRAAAHRRSGPERGVAAYRRTPERE